MAQRFHVTVPATVPTGGPFRCEIAAVDGRGRPADDYEGYVHLCSMTADGVVRVLGRRHVSGGRGRFDDLSVEGAGVGRIVAIDLEAGLAGVSNGFEVAPT